MRIWMINHYAVPPSSGGGTRHYNFARELISRGHDVVIFAANYSHFSHAYNNTCNQEVPFHWVAVPPYKGNTLGRFWNMLVFGWRIWRFKPRNAMPKPDVIIGSSPHLFAAFGAALLAARLDVPFVMEVRDIWPESLVDLGKFTHRHPLIRLMKHMEKWLYRRAKKIISLLPAAAPYFIEQGINPSDVIWLPNYVDIRNKNSLSLQPQQSEKFTVMYAGAHGLANDLDTVISAADILQKKALDQKIKICLMGEGPEKYRLQARAAALGIHMVEFLDAVPKEIVYTFLAKADAFLMLLKKSPVFRWGVSPNKLFDYLLMGRPVIFAVDTPVDPVSISGAGLSVMPGDPQSLASAIEALSHCSADQRDAMGEKGYDYVARHHDIIKLTDVLEALLEEVIKNANSG